MYKKIETKFSIQVYRGSFWQEDFFIYFYFVFQLGKEVLEALWLVCVVPYVPT